MSLHGEPVDTTQYLVGNPLIARRIIGLNRTAALHAPFPGRFAGRGTLPYQKARRPSPQLRHRA